MPKRKCEACGGKGWVVIQSHGSKFYADDDLHIERCDACEGIESDSEAEDMFLLDLSQGEANLPELKPLTLYNGYREYCESKKESKRARSRKRKA